MSLQKENHELHLDDRLAEFTDEILVGNEIEISGPDEELSGLKQTILRLKTAYPPKKVSEAEIKQMYVRLKNRTKRDDSKSELPFLRRWLGNLQTRSLIVVAILLVFVFLSPAFSSAGSSITAFALNPTQGALTICVGSAVIVLLVWIVRRK